MYSNQPACSIDNTIYGNGTGGKTGSITLLVVGGSAPYTYQWLRNGIAYSTQQNINNLDGATYTVIVNDSSNPKNTGMGTVTLVNPSTVLPNVSITPPLCSTSSGGIIRVTPTGGTAPYTYLWSNGITGNGTSFPPGNCSVVITDANGCGYSFSFIVPQTPPESLEIQQTKEGDTIVLTALFSCVGGTVLWSTGETTPSIEAVAETTYSVTLTCPKGEAGNCTLSASVTPSDQDNSYYCCLVSVLSEEATDDFNGAKPCECQEGLILINLIGVYERNFDNTNCLTKAQMDYILSVLNNMCCNCG